MTLADDLKPLLSNARSIAGTLGLRPYTVAVQVVSHSGTYTGEGTETDTSTSILEYNGQPPKVRTLSGDELALGNLAQGSWEIGPITPDYATGGTTWETLVGGTATDGQQVHIILTGPEFPDGERFVIVNTASDHALHFKIQVSPLSART